MMCAVINEWHVTCKKQIDYDIVCCDHIFDLKNRKLLTGYGVKNSRRFVIVDHVVYQHYGKQIKAYFQENEVPAKIVSFISGEANKSMDNYIRLLHELNSFPIRRRSDPIISIGGGVLTDIVGFMASSYRRGVPHIKVPTTLMAYVDAAVGIKTGINFGHYKNRIGAFVPPHLVILDKLFFKTLPYRHILNGVGEIIKLATIKDESLFTFLEKNVQACIENKFQCVDSEIILEKSITGMLAELQPNLYEDNLARAMDFGHTFSPMIEMQSERDILHGEAVVIDVLFSSVLAHIHSGLSLNELMRIINLITKLQFTIDCQLIKPELLWQSIIERTDHRDGLQRIPLPHAIGQYSFSNNIRFATIKRAYKLMRQLLAGYQGCR